MNTNENNYLKTTFVLVVLFSLFNLSAIWYVLWFVFGWLFFPQNTNESKDKGVENVN